MSFDVDELLGAGAAGADGDADDFVVIADHFLGLGQPKLALVALDRAYGLRPDDPNIAAQRQALLDAQAIVEHGMTFRYVPAGTFLMGSTTGDPDERPVHPVSLDEFWVADIPCTWARYCELLGWDPPPDGAPPDDEDEDAAFGRFHFYLRNGVRRSYCDVDDDQAESDYDRKPMVAVTWQDAELLGERLSTAAVRYELPSEAQWEKAARGGLIGQRYPWGSAPPDPSRCDCDHFGRWEIAEPRTLPANGYGLYGMSGGVWEWTRTIYDALAYAQRDDPPDYAALAEDTELRRVLRGGSWTDAAAAVTVSFRHALVGYMPSIESSDSFTPNVGFRLIRRELGPARLGAREDEDRAAILERRRQFQAQALAGLGDDDPRDPSFEPPVGVRPQVCLKVGRHEREAESWWRRIFKRGR